MGSKPSKAREKLTGRKVVSVYLCFFAVFAGIGYLRGKATQRDPAYLQWVVFKEKRVSVERDIGGVHLTYSCPGRPYKYYVDTDRIDRQRSSEPLRSEETLTLIFKDTALISTFLGGVTAWTVKDMFAYISGGGGALSRNHRIRLAVTAVVGAASGYYVGFYLAVESRPPCDSDMFEPVLENPKTWEKWETILWKARLRGLADMFKTVDDFRLPGGEEQHIQDQIWKEAAATLKRLNTSTASSSYNITTADFNAADEVERSLRRYTDLYKSKPPSVGAVERR